MPARRRRACRAAARDHRRRPDQRALDREPHREPHDRRGFARRSRARRRPRQELRPALLDRRLDRVRHAAQRHHRRPAELDRRQLHRAVHRIRHPHELPLLRLVDRQQQHRLDRPNLSLEAGPLRILANHLNGSPQHNIELRGNKSLTIIGNICEGARREAIVFTMPAWADSDDEQVAIVGNNITNGGKSEPDAYPAIGIYARDAEHRTMGFNITGNFIANTDDDAGWSHAVDARYVDNLAITGNQWDNNGFSVAAVRADGRNVGIAGNSSANLPTREVHTVAGDTVMAAAPGVDYVYLVSRGELTLPTAVGNTSRYTVKSIAGTTRVHAPDGQRVDCGSVVQLGSSDAVDVISDGTDWWTL
ncbi:MAG: hypothetical protein E6Q55_22805 [Mycolicibacterium mageritense]|nr:MAG: hypothetical protein E6Q55_22805 [Mycolicibacterium mageritense]